MSWVDAAIQNGWGIGEWAEISGPSPSHGLSTTNTLRDVKSVNPSDSKLQGILKNWCGGGFAPDKGVQGSLIVAPGGGHGGYESNDSFAFDVETRTWSELRPLSTGNLDSTFGEYPDGSPAGYHTYGQVAVTPPLTGHPEGILILPKSVDSTSSQTPSASTPYPHFLDLANPQNGWMRLAEIPESSRSSWREGMAGAWDSSRNLYWLWAMTEGESDNMIASLDPLTNVWTNIALGHNYRRSGIEQNVVHDPIRDILISIDYRKADKIHYLFPGDITASYNGKPWRITETGSGPSKKPGRGVCWSGDSILYWDGATTDDVWELKYASGSVGTENDAGDLTYNWTHLTAATNTITPESQESNDGKIWGRFQKAGRFAVTVTNVDGAVYAFRLN